ncbi:hypothetical protein DNTS_022142 [Danionella cerebrum]|uniref:Uncharacterized protein n=1 Tax=Danionella cerebrum TaxID=2873325 RepID=A0A553R0Q3_9TELE|nr:hypothetical protein DNTS_022142 [Danionella translucida]
MALMFGDEEFEMAWGELDEPLLAGGWELFTETMGVRIYRLYSKETGLYEYKVSGSLDGCPPELCSEVYMDLNYRKHWDSYAKDDETTVFDRTDPASEELSCFGSELVKHG